MPSDQPPTQYDAIADAYAILYPPNLHPSPFLHARLEAQQLRHAFLATSPTSINLQGKRVLDLAGGNGHYGLRLLAWGAASVVSVDISGEMARRGRVAAAVLGVGEERLRFVVADAVGEGLVIEGEGEGEWGGKEGGGFDVGLERIWTNVGRQLRGGGWFVGLVPPPVLTGGRFEGELLSAAYADDGVWGRHGTGGKVLEKTVAGFRVETTLGVPGLRGAAAGQDVRFEHYHVRKEVLEDSLAKTGLFGALEWRDWVVENEFRREYPDLADDATLMPHCRPLPLPAPYLAFFQHTGPTQHTYDAAVMIIQEIVGNEAVKTILIVIGLISLVVFVALFGRLPAFRRTPIAFLHKLFVKYIPNAFVWVDSYLTGRRLSRALFSTGHYLMYEKHPIVLIFFVLLQTLGELALVPKIWSTLHPIHKLLIPIAIILPHYTLYLTATTDSTIPLAPNTLPQQTPPSPGTTTTPPTDLDFGPAHAAAMHAYPYDYLLYHPGYFCSTCRFPKPARSKHCSLCKGCIEKQDHHCIWVNNCVGRRNYAYFLALLVAITVLLVYGVCLGWRDMLARLEARYVPGEGSVGRKTWSGGTTWSVWFDRLAWALVVDVRVGATTLLCAMCTPLGAAFLAYHAYLLWVGMTTNEQGKWSDWKEDVNDEVVFRAEIEQLRRGLVGGGDGAVGGSVSAKGDAALGAYPPLPREIEPPASEVDWPPRRIPAAMWEVEEGMAAHRPRWWYIRTRHGDQPVVRMSASEARKRGLQVAGYHGGEENGNTYANASGAQVEVEDTRWQRVLSMRREMDNVYDLGMWGNLMEVFYHRL